MIGHFVSQGSSTNDLRLFDSSGIEPPSHENFRRGSQSTRSDRISIYLKDKQSTSNSVNLLKTACGGSQLLFGPATTTGPTLVRPPTLMPHKPKSNPPNFPAREQGQSIVPDDQAKIRANLQIIPNLIDSSADASFPSFQ